MVERDEGGIAEPLARFDFCLRDVSCDASWGEHERGPVDMSFAVNLATDSPLKSAQITPCETTSRKKVNSLDITTAVDRPRPLTSLTDRDQPQTLSLSFRPDQRLPRRRASGRVALMQFTSS